MSAKAKTANLTPRGEKRRNQLLESALLLFGEKGYRATSIEDICSAARTGKGTFYWYWSGKEELFHELITRKFETYLAAVGAVAESDTTAAHKVRLLVEQIGSVLVRYRQFCKLVFLLIADDNELFHADVLRTARGYYAKFREALTGLIREGQRDGSIDRNVKPALAATLLIAILDGLLVQEKVLDQTFRVDELGKTLLKILEAGMLAP